jgi:hypothetical protein
VVRHHGSSAQAGHYTAMCKDYTDTVRTCRVGWWGSVCGVCGVVCVVGRCLVVLTVRYFAFSFVVLRGGVEC